jgi:hypothetical protein
MKAWAALLLWLLPVSALADATVRIQSDHWTAADERGYGEFITAIGESGCRSVDACLKNPANPFRASDPAGTYFESDCADLPYVLRFYYAWKRGLPFSYVSDVSPRGRARDMRYSASGNRVEERRDVLSGDNALAVLARIRDAVSSATYRIHPALEEPLNDLYSPAIRPGAIRAGTVIYDPNGHLAIIYRIESDGRIRYIDAHPDNSLTRGLYDLRFVRASPGMGAGFKNWRPQKLVGYTAAQGALMGGQVLTASNAIISDFALTQFFGTSGMPSDSDWRSGAFVLNGAQMDWYDYVRASLGGGALHFDPVREMAEAVVSNCADLGYRADAVTLSLQVGLQNQPQPPRLPPNIYGTEGDWETYSTPSRDARLKTAFKEARDNAQRFLTLWRARDPRITYQGSDLAGDMLAAYDRAAGQCVVSYTRSDGSRVQFGYEEARRRLFRLSFDPYHCVEQRWGAAGPELATCRDGTLKRRWYDAEQRLRNQLDRSYEARMDFSLGELESGQGGAAASPDTDARGYLLAEQKRR